MLSKEDMSISLTPSQSAAWDALSRFFQDPCARIFILRGYAGTGKTTLIAHIARALEAHNREPVLLAPTGRAARVLSAYSRKPASTIHSHIYNFCRFIVKEKDAAHYQYEFVLSRNNDSYNAVYIIDEASMVSDQASENETLRFGSGRLLSDLLRFVFGVHDEYGDHKLVLVGDPAQLPPVNSSASPALEPSYITDTFGYTPYMAELIDVTRTEAENPLTTLATSLRESIRRDDYTRFLIETDGNTIRSCSTLDLDEWVRNLRSTDDSNRILITHSNVQAHFYNRAIRARLFPGQGTIVKGDRLVVMTNTRINNVTLLNGDVLEVLDVAERAEEVNIPLVLKRKKETRRILLRFRRIIAMSHADQTHHNLILLENLLDSPTRDITDLEERALFVYFRIRHKNLKPDSEDFPLELARDPYFNALRAKYAYAVTCHKAQGGEWPSVAIDFNTSHTDTTSAEFFRWAYTAVTRARRQLIAINPPIHTSDLSVLQRAFQRNPRPEPFIVTSSVSCEIGSHDTADIPPERLPFILAIRQLAQEAGAQLLSFQNRERRIRALFKLPDRDMAFDFLISCQNSVSQVIPIGPTDSPAAAAFENHLRRIEGRPVVITPCPTTQLPLDADHVRQHAPFPAADAPIIMRQFDEALRARIAAMNVVIISVEFLTTHQIRYVFRDACTDERAAILYFFNGKHCTSYAIDGRRTTSAELAGRILTIHRTAQSA